MRHNFTKAFPVNLALEVGMQKSDTVIFEIAERNLIWFAQSPPVNTCKGVKCSQCGKDSCQ